MKLLHSLRVRLLLMFMFVVIVTLATVAFIQQQATTSAFQNYTKNAKEIYPVHKDVLPIIDNILATYQSGNLIGSEDGRGGDGERGTGYFGRFQ